MRQAARIAACAVVVHEIKNRAVFAVQADEYVRRDEVAVNEAVRMHAPNFARELTQPPPLLPDLCPIERLDEALAQHLDQRPPLDFAHEEKRAARKPPHTLPPRRHYRRRVKS